MPQESRDFTKCLHGGASPCTLACPFGMDVRAFVEKLQRGSFGPAYNMLRTAAAFPELVCRLCDHPCERSCNGALSGSGLSVSLLERAAIDFNRRKEPPRTSYPPQEKKVAVIGGDLGALACALRLAERKYAVTVYFPEEKPAMDAAADLPYEIIEEELRLQFLQVQCTFVNNTLIRTAEELPERYDAVYFSAGDLPEAGEVFPSVSARAEACTEPEKADREKNSAAEPQTEGRIFLAEKSAGPMGALREGLRMFGEILWYLQTGSRKPAESAAGDTAEVRFDYRDIPAKVLPENGEVFSKAEAREEALRCKKCECSRCLDACVLLRQSGMTPANLSRGVGTSVDLFEETQGHEAMREIASCTNCGLCREVCPVGLDIGGMLLDARAALHKRGSLPPAHHEYWLRDYAFSESEEAAVTYFPKGKPCGAIFFPGCQAGGSDPSYITKSYERLLEFAPDTALVLECCGASALWSGEKKLFEEKCASIRMLWKEAGQPEFIMLCPSCYRIFREYLAEIPVRMFFEVPGMDALLSADAEGNPYGEAALFDPCASRTFSEMQNTVRALLTKSGYAAGELPYSKETAQCCSFGGHGYASNPFFVKAQVREVLAEDEKPYICYCANCRDVLRAQGKDCVHLLDLILGEIPGAERVPPTISERRERRRHLKNELIRRYGLKDAEVKEGRAMEVTIGTEAARMPLMLSAEAEKKMNDRLILAEELAEVIDRSEEEQRYLVDADSGLRIAHRKIGYVTYWVSYKVDTDTVTVTNAYSHRMRIRHETMEEEQ